MMNQHLQALLSLSGLVGLSFGCFGADALDAWTVRRPATDSFYLRDIIFAQDKFVTVGTAGSVLTSPDGLEWTPQQLPEQPNILASIAYGKGLFVAVGNSTFVAVGRVGNVSTSDGVIWRQRNPSPVAGLNLFGVTYARSSFWIVGQGGGIWQSAHYAPLLLRATGFSPEGFTLTLQGEIGRSYAIQAANDAAPGAWQELGVIVNEQESSSFTDKTVAGAAARFYRAQAR